MNRIIFTTLALFVAINLWAQSDDSPASIKRHQLLFSPIYLFDATFLLSYEHLFQNQTALRITPSITLSNTDNSVFHSNLKSREGFAIDAGYKVFLFEKPRRNANVYMGPYVMYKYVKHTRGTWYSSIPDDPDIVDIYKVWGVGIDTGIKFIMGRFVMDITVGGGVRYPLLNDDANVPAAEGILDIGYKGIAPRINFCLGVTL